MIIDGNQKEKDAMIQFHLGNPAKGHQMQDEFIAEFHEEYAEKDHCPCTAECRFHGKCRDCVTIHRAHRDHVPYCMRDMLNERIRMLSELTEHTVLDDLAAKG